MAVTWVDHLIETGVYFPRFTNRLMNNSLCLEPDLPYSIPCVIYDEMSHVIPPHRLRQGRSEQTSIVSHEQSQQAHNHTGVNFTLVTIDSRTTTADNRQRVLRMVVRSGDSHFATTSIGTTTTIPMNRQTDSLSLIEFNSKPFYYQYLFFAKGNSHTYTQGGWHGCIHNAVLTNLKPSTTYYYRVGNKYTDIWSEEFSFVSPPLSLSGMQATCCD
jgi:hypothetical protein